MPNAWGFGFRWPTDHIWGVWEADAIAANISKSVGTLLSQYGNKLDIIYDDGSIYGNDGYSQLIYWNAYDPNPTPSPSPTPSPTEIPTPSPSPTPEPPVSEPIVTMLILVTAITVPAVLVSVVLFAYFKKRKA